jgi:hypothetical protein
MEAPMYADNSYEELSRQSLVTKAVAINDTGRAYFRSSVLAERAATKLKNFTKRTARWGASRS